MKPAATTFELNGFLLLSQFASPIAVDKLRAAVAELTECHRAGVRDLLRRCPQVAEFASSPEILERLAAFATVAPFPVRAILFDKTPDRNWLVAWHQDLTIAVRDRHETTGFGTWSLKDGTHHVQPPTKVLEQMLTLRLHLDDCDANNGALRVLPGSHRHGKLAPEEIAKQRVHIAEHVCEARAGDALLMRPLLLHASSPAKKPRRRRVVHIEFASENLPNGLEWFERSAA